MSAIKVLHKEVPRIQVSDNLNYFKIRKTKTKISHKIKKEEPNKKGERKT